jgi:hypothetical protein
MHNVVSVDGFIADENDDVGPLHEWYFNGDTPITQEITWSWCPIGPSPRVGTRRRPTTSSPM